MTVLGLPLVDAWAMAGACIAAMALALRGEILKPELGGFFTGPRVVRLSVTFTSIALAGRMISIGGGSHAQPAEAAVYSALAWSASVLFWNLHRQRPTLEQGAGR